MPARGMTVRRFVAVGVDGADHGCAGRLREHRLLGRRPRRRRLARAVRRRSQQQLLASRRRERVCALDWSAIGQGRPRRPGRARARAATSPPTRQTAGGCSLMVWEPTTRAASAGAPGWWQGGGLSSPLFDGFDNLYVGQPGAMLSFPPTQWIRWRNAGDRPADDTADSRARPAAGGHAPRSGAGVRRAPRHVVGTSLDLVEGVDPTDSQRGLADCQPARPGCPVAAAPAFSPATGIVVVRLWEPDAEAPVVVGLRYRPARPRC